MSRDSPIDVVVSVPSSAPAVEELFADHCLALVRLARHLVDDLDTAEDVVQEVFAALARTSAPVPTDAERYLRSAVINRSRSALRRRRVSRLAALGRWRHEADVAPAADAELLASERRRQVLDAVGHLPSRQREVVVLKYYLDLDIAEIAQLLGISPSAASSSLGRAITSLTSILGDDHA